MKPPEISRRDFINGMLIGTSVMVLDLRFARALSQPFVKKLALRPSERMGLRGHHPGSFEQIHNLAFSGGLDVKEFQDTREHYDFVIIGAGISGLTAAHLLKQNFQHRRRSYRLLILENHDDFGGHAKRLEFSFKSKRNLSYGGTQSFDHPSEYSLEVRKILSDLGINFEKLGLTYHKEFFAHHQLAMGLFFDKMHFGQNKLIKSSLPTLNPATDIGKYFLPGLLSSPDFKILLEEMPLSAKQKSLLKSILADSSPTAKKLVESNQDLESISYTDFLRKHYQISDESLLLLLSMTSTEDSAMGGSMISLAAAVEMGLLGTKVFQNQETEDKDVTKEDREDEYIYHFPDGGATVARALVASLLPIGASSQQMTSDMDVDINYQLLDLKENPVRLRLQSTVLNVEKTDKGSRGRYKVHYSEKNKNKSVTAEHIIMAGWNMVAPHIFKFLPDSQKQAQKANVKMPLVYAQIALHSWEPLEKSQCGACYCPGSYFQFVQMDFPVEMKGCKYPQSPKEPVTLLMVRMPCDPLSPEPVEARLRAGRATLLSLSFQDFENQIFHQLDSMYSSYGFSSKKHISGITVNRWSHGYTYEDAKVDGKPAHVLARTNFQNIFFANSDSEGSAYMDAAIESAIRAVDEWKDQI